MEKLGLIYEWIVFDNLIFSVERPLCRATTTAAAATTATTTTESNRIKIESK